MTYFEDRLAQIKEEVGKRSRGRSAFRWHKPRKAYTHPYRPPPRPEAIDKIGGDYVLRIRSSMQHREATWFDVAAAYAQGWKDAASGAERRSGEQ